MLYQIDLAANQEDRKALLKGNWDFFQKNKNLILADEELTKILQEKLVQLYTFYDWGSANLYYFNIFGKQLVT